MQQQLELSTTLTRRAVLHGTQASVIDFRKKFRLTETIVRYALFFCGLISILTTIGIVYILASESLLFFNSNAWVIAKAPVAEAEATAALVSPINESDTTLTLSFEGRRVPFTTEQYIQIGSETMQVKGRTDTTVTVQRGMDGTQAAQHSAEAPVFPMQTQQVKTVGEMDAETTTITVPETFGREFIAGNVIQLDQEIMRVVEINGDMLTVERGFEGTQAKAHDEETAIAIADYVTFTEFATATQWQPQAGNFGVLPLLNSTLLISLVALIVAIPLGLASAIYLSEYARPEVRAILKPVLEILAGVPTVVFGFFAVTLVTPGLQGLFGEQVQFTNMLSAGLVVGILIVPLISSMSEDAINAVPLALREASYGLGATKFETTIKVVFPAAISGIVAAIIVAMSRAVGETMIVALAAGSGPNFTFNLFTGAETMTGHIARISGGDLSYNSIDYNSLFAIGMTLFVVTLALNLISTFIARRLRERY